LSRTPRRTTPVPVITVEPQPADVAGMRRVGAGHVTVRVERDPEGVVFAPVLFSSGVLSARLTPWGVCLVGAGAHPIGDDCLFIEVDVGKNTNLAVGSTGATIARAGARRATSTTNLVAQVGDHATLRWLVEPGIAVAGASHVAQATIQMSASACLLWRDEVVLGRFAEPPGTWISEIRVERMGRAVVTSRLGLGPEAPGWSSAAILHGSPAVVSLVAVDPKGFPTSARSAPIIEAGAKGIISCSEDSLLAQITAWGDTLGGCRAVADRLFRRLGSLEWLNDIRAAANPTEPASPPQKECYGTEDRPDDL